MHQMIGFRIHLLASSSFLGPFCSLIELSCKLDKPKAIEVFYKLQKQKHSLNACMRILNDQFHLLFDPIICL